MSTFSPSSGLKMRLSLVLAKWPKIRPKGNIWIG